MIPLSTSPVPALESAAVAGGVDGVLPAVGDDRVAPLQHHDLPERPGGRGGDVEAAGVVGGHVVAVDGFQAGPSPPGAASAPPAARKYVGHRFMSDRRFSASASITIGLSRRIRRVTRASASGRAAEAGADDDGVGLLAGGQQFVLPRRLAEADADQFPAPPTARAAGSTAAPRVARGRPHPQGGRAGEDRRARSSRRSRRRRGPGRTCPCARRAGAGKVGESRCAPSHELTRRAARGLADGRHGALFRICGAASRAKTSLPKLAERDRVEVERADAPPRAARALAGRHGGVVGAVSHLGEEDRQRERRQRGAGGRGWPRRRRR